MEHQSYPHVLMFPFPVQGHITPMLQFAELLCLANFKVTFLNTCHNQQRLTQYCDIEGRFSRYPGFIFQTIPDGLPDDHPRAGEKMWLAELDDALTSSAKPLIREILEEKAGSSKVTCFIVDGWLSFAIDIANEVEVPVIAFIVQGASFVWSHYCIPKLIEEREIPFKDDEEMDELVKNVPGMDTFLRYRDLPDYCRTKDLSLCKYLQDRFTREIQQRMQAHSFIINTFEELEGPILSLMRSHYCSKIYPIGPLHTHIKYKLSEKDKSFSKTSPIDLWKVDRNCILWLDQKPDKSVVYVSFGSLTVLTKDQLMEFWIGLIQSKKHFLWAIRPDLILGCGLDNTIQEDLLALTKERGCLVGWAPQEEVLAHRAIGGFFTHSGWNSILESISAGVPMLCWPFFTDHPVYSRLVGEVWRIGLDMKDMCDRTTVENMINDLMEKKKDKLQTSAYAISLLAKSSIIEGGSSHSNLNHILEEINMMFNKEMHSIQSRVV